MKFSVLSTGNLDADVILDLPAIVIPKQKGDKGDTGDLTVEQQLAVDEAIASRDTVVPLATQVDQDAKAVEIARQQVVPLATQVSQDATAVEVSRQQVVPLAQQVSVDRGIVASDREAAQVARLGVDAVGLLLGATTYPRRFDMNQVVGSANAKAYVYEDITPANNGLFFWNPATSTWVKDTFDVFARLSANDAAGSIGQNLSLITDTTLSNASAYVATVRSAQSALSVSINSLLTFAPNTTSAENPTLTINGITRTIKDITGSNLPAASLLPGASYTLRVVSATEVRIHGMASTLAQQKIMESALGGYKIRNSAAALSRPGDNPSLFQRSFTGAPDLAPPMDFSIVDLGEDGGKVARITNNSIAKRERFPFGSGQRYKFLFKFRVHTASTAGSANVSLMIRCMNDAFTGLSTNVVWSQVVTVAAGWTTVEIDTNDFTAPTGTTQITPVLRHNLADGGVDVQIIEDIRISVVGSGTQVSEWTPPIRPNAVMSIHNDYPTYRNWVTPPYAPIVLSGTTGYYTFAWPHPRVCIQADSGRKLDLTHMVRGTSFRYIVRTGTGGIFAGYGRTFFGQGSSNYVTVPANCIVDVGYDASSAYTFLTVTAVVGNLTFSTISEPIADKSILYAGQSLAAQAYQMGSPGGFYHAQQNGDGGVTAIRDTIRFILGAEGGTTLDKRGNTTRYWWDRDTDAPGPVLLDCISSINAAIAEGQPRPVAVFWNQGQSDATYISGGTYGYADYLSQLTKVLSYLQVNGLNNVGRFICTPISRADRTTHNLGANAVRQAQLTTISSRSDCYLGPEEYDLSGEGGLDVHLSPKGYFTSGYRMFRAWYNAMNGGSLSMGPVVNTVTRTDANTVVITLSGASRLPVGKGVRAGQNIDFGPNPFMWGAIPAGQNGDQGQITFTEGTLVGSTLTLKANSSLVGARLIYPHGYANGWRDATYPTNSESHLDYDGQPLRTYISAPIA